MADARRREAWSHTCEVLAVLWNAHFEKKREPRDFGPFAREHRENRAAVKMKMSDFKSIFVGAVGGRVAAQTTPTVGPAIGVDRKA